MEVLYEEVRAVHVAAALASGSLFFVRGLLLNVLGSRWGQRRQVRFCSYAIDTVLLAAAILLTTLVGQYPGVDAWLTVKVVLIVVYIALGHLALKRARSRGGRVASWLAAAMVFGLILAVAHSHHPLGPLAGWLS